MWHRPRLLEAMTLRHARRSGWRAPTARRPARPWWWRPCAPWAATPRSWSGGQLVDLNTNAHRGEPRPVRPRGRRGLRHLPRGAPGRPGRHQRRGRPPRLLRDGGGGGGGLRRGGGRGWRARWWPAWTTPGPAGWRSAFPGSSATGWTRRPRGGSPESSAEPAAVSFTLAHGGAAVAVTVPRPGLHVARNAAGVLALLGELGFDVAGAAAGLASFGGVRRRFEVRARIRGVTVIDDYAHHPTEVAATIAAARAGGRRAGSWPSSSRTASAAPPSTPAGSARRWPRPTGWCSPMCMPPGRRRCPGVSGRLVADAAIGRGGRGHLRAAPRRPRRRGGRRGPAGGPRAADGGGGHHPGGRGTGRACSGGGGDHPGRPGRRRESWTGTSRWPR